MRSTLNLLGLVSGLGLFAACSAGAGGAVFGTTSTSGVGGGSGTTGSESTTGSGMGGDDIGFDGGPAGSGGGPPTCNSAPNEDKDMDGFTVVDKDCNDCDPNVNPGAIEVIAPMDADGGVPEPADEDCDGMVDNVPVPTCDETLALDASAALDGAHAIDLCQSAPAEGGYGVISANWIRADGTVVEAPGQKVGMFSSFGTNVPPLAGGRILGMSSGKARLIGQDGACNDVTCEVGGQGTAPSGFPADVPNCNGGPGTEINDDIGLQVTLRAPSNATGYSFDFKFATFEYPIFVCSEFNDQFVALVNPAPPGSQNGNISFDSANNPVSVNIGFFDVCSTCDQYAIYCFVEELNPNCPPAPNPCCPAGGTALVGTGFGFNEWGQDEAGGGTQWLRTQAPVQPGSEFTIDFTLWDAGDQALDSTVVIDNFRWIASGGTVVEVGTGETPDVPN